MRTGRLRQRGITLVEASVATSIAVILTATAAPHLGNFVEKQRLDGAAAQLASDLQLARAEAVMRNEPLRLTVHGADAGACYVIHTGPADDCSCAVSGPAVCSGDARQLKTVSLPAADGITLAGNVGSILFDPLHGTSTPSGTLKLISTSGRAVHQVVNVMGRVRTCSPSGDAGAVPGYRVC